MHYCPDNSAVASVSLLRRPSLPRDSLMEQWWNNARAKSLRLPALARKHCSIDLSFSFARRALPSNEKAPGRLLRPGAAK